MVIDTFSPTASPAGVAGVISTDVAPSDTLKINWVDTASAIVAGSVVYVGQVGVTPSSSTTSSLSVTSESEAVDADFDPVPLPIDHGIVAAPEPGAGWMLCAGLVGLAWLVRLRRAGAGALALTLFMGAAGPGAVSYTHLTLPTKA